jgi:hypothetical protein
VNLYGLLTSIAPQGKPPYPFALPSLCVYLVLTEARGAGSMRVQIVLEETGQRVFQSTPQPVQFGNNPLALLRFSLRVRNFKFPGPGNYAIQFWYNGVNVAERLLRLE